MAIIEEISIKNYRVLRKVTLKGIQPFSVFLGPNGSGKTTFFEVILKSLKHKKMNGLKSNFLIISIGK